MTHTALAHRIAALLGPRRDSRSRELHRCLEAVDEHQDGDARNGGLSSSLSVAAGADGPRYRPSTSTTTVTRTRASTRSTSLPPATAPYSTSSATSRPKWRAAGSGSSPCARAAFARSTPPTPSITTSGTVRVTAFFDTAGDYIGWHRAAYQHVVPSRGEGTWLSWNNAGAEKPLALGRRHPRRRPRRRRVARIGLQGDEEYLQRPQGRETLHHGLAPAPGGRGQPRVSHALARGGRAQDGPAHVRPEPERHALRRARGPLRRGGSAPALATGTSPIIAGRRAPSGSSTAALWACRARRPISATRPKASTPAFERGLRIAGVDSGPAWVNRPTAPLRRESRAREIRKNPPSKRSAANGAGPSEVVIVPRWTARDQRFNPGMSDT